MIKTYRVSSDISLVNTNGVIVFLSDAPSSEIPYFVLITKENGKLIVKNEFVNRDESIEIQRVTANISLKIGEKTGRIYEIKAFLSIKRNDILTSMILYINKSFSLNEKKFKNAFLSYQIIRTLFLKLEKEE